MSNDHCLRHFTAPVIFALNTYWWKSFRFVFCDDDKALKIQNSLRYGREGTGAFLYEVNLTEIPSFGRLLQFISQDGSAADKIQCKLPEAVFLRGEEKQKIRLSVIISA